MTTRGPLCPLPPCLLGLGRSHRRSRAKTPRPLWDWGRSRRTGAKAPRPCTPRRIPIPLLGPPPPPCCPSSTPPSSCSLQDLPLPEPPHFALAAAEREASYELLYGTLALPWVRGEGTYLEVVQAVRRQRLQLRRQEGCGLSPKLHALQEYFRALLRAWQEHTDGDPSHHGYMQTLEDDLWWYYGVELRACWSVRQYVKGRYGTEALKAVREGECDEAPAEGARHCAPRASREAAVGLLRLVRGLAGPAGGGGRVDKEQEEAAALPGMTTELAAAVGVQAAA